MSASLLPTQRHEEEGEMTKERSPVTTGRDNNGSYKTATIGGGVLLLLLLTIGIVPRLRRQGELSAATREQEQAAQSVGVVTPRLGDATNELILPATTQAIQDTVIFARTGGYVRRWFSGMGQHVKEGQLLAEIAKPETDQELREARQQVAEAEQNVTQSRSELGQAQAALEQAEAALKQALTNLELARVNLERSKTLVAQGVVSRQDTDDKQATFDARQADVEAAQANIRARQAAIKAQQSAIESRVSNFSGRQANAQRIVELQSFEKVIAPYAGIITARNVEVGTLISSSGSTPTGTGLYRIARLDIIRIFINVPQTFAPAMRKGLQAEVQIKEMAPKVFTGNVIGTSNSIDPATRTLMVEVRIPNPDEQLLPGMYAQVKFVLPTSNRAVLIPASTLISNSEGIQVMIVRPDQTVHIQKIEVGRDFGKEIEVTSGLNGDEPVIGNPNDALHEGTRVQVIKSNK